ncbi:hypothetical protein V6N13_071780 [Hibiscus sabdariffa]
MKGVSKFCMDWTPFINTPTKLGCRIARTNSFLVNFPLTNISIYCSYSINSTMKKKMLVKVTMNGDKSRSKALKIAVGLSGVESASLKGDDKSQIEVTGDGVDAVKLTSLLRKSVGHAELVSVADEKKEEKKEEPKPKPKPEPPTPIYYVSTPYYPRYYYQPVPSYGYVQDHGPSCSIM